MTDLRWDRPVKVGPPTTRFKSSRNRQKSGERNPLIATHEGTCHLCGEKWAVGEPIIGVGVGLTRQYRFVHENCRPWERSWS